MQVLVVAAHPDDELLGAGGTVALHAARGDRVTLAVMCEGISVRYPAERRSEVASQSRRAAAILGAAGVHLGDLPEQRLDTLPISEVTGHVERLVQDVRPEVVYTHFAGDINRDHQVLAEAVRVATRPYAAPFVREVLMFETPSSTEWGGAPGLAVFAPTVFVDVATTIERKVEAFLCYDAEVRPFPHPRSPESLRARAAYWGSLVNRSAAEPFVIARAVR